ncbi:glycosyltransferase [uncultured Helicobacter sp.]|uniref:glycosyltransferase n=1 Tax=uncultured Helicobacter sp. TaxID=175537 RepID=UPI00262DCAA8|nr:glycosyltransferase [uncultured Helicobacter sp.]
MSANLPCVSIITIVYNDREHIKDTMDSVISQDYPMIEYIIIDGASTDGTKAFIESYIASMCDITLKDTQRFYMEATHRTKAHFTFKFLSQKDKGIYDAMNKGIDLATGEWCNFMNCGDRFYAHTTIRELFERYLLDSGGGHIILSMAIHTSSMIIPTQKSFMHIILPTNITIALFINPPLLLLH